MVLLGEAAVEQIVNEAQAFGDRLRQITRMPALWRAAQKPVTNHDSAEDISETALKLADQIESLRRSMAGSALAALMSEEIFKGDVSQVGQVVARIDEHVDRIDVGLVEVLFSASARRSVREFCGQVQERQTVTARLARSLRDASGWNIEERLSAARDFADQNGKTISPERHGSRHADLLKAVTPAERIVEAAKRLPDAWTNSDRNLSEIRADALRIASQSEAVLSLRIPDPLCAAESVAAEIERRLTALSSKIGRIRQALPGAGGSHDAAQIRRAAKIIERSGPLRFLSSSYKSARNTYLNILLGRRDDTRLAMSQRMQEYADWLEKMREFDQEPRFTERFGPLFKGINTEMEEIRSAALFHELTAEISAGSVDLKSYLETGNLEPTLYFANLEEGIPPQTLAEAEARITGLREEIAREETLLSEARGHLLIFRDREEVPFDEIEEVVALKSAEKELSERINYSAATDVIGGRFAPIDTPTDLLLVECEIAEAIAGLGNPSSAVSALRTGALSGLQAQFDNFTDRRQQIDKLIEILREDLGLEDGFSDASEFAERVEDLRAAAADPDSLLNRAQLKRAEDSLREQGLGDMVDWVFAQGDDFDPTRLGPIVRAIIAKSMADAAYDRFPESLLGYDGQDFDQIRAEIAQTDRELVLMSRRVIVDKLLTEARPPSGNNIGRKSDFTDLSLIYNELHKKKRRIGLRELTRRAGKALLELKPCWMMSPLAVAQYLHADMRFDLVVIDEASQMTPENAVGALSRAGRAVIVGDTKQLPPTSFFQKVLDDSDTDEDLREDSESILDMANVAFMPIRQLRWHYRSRHPSLIQFSNHWMYKDELTIFPSALERHPDLGVELKETHGTYKGRRNEIEARAVVEAAVRHMTQLPKLSLGICTMNVDQKDLILEEFERERDRNPRVRDFVENWEEENDALEEFFIKNLETIQGDERDVMMISTLYGPETAGGRVHQRFGPINSAHGHRRLNVLFTRAKKKIITFTSLKPTDVLVDGNKNIGVKMFRAWLEYSKTGHVPDKAGPQGGTESPFEDYVAAQIERLGYEVVPQVGVAGFRIDLGVRHPSWSYGYILGVECDGATYHSSKSSRDRDRLRQEVLEGLGWRLHRIWSTDWFRNPRKEIEVLSEVIADALSRAKEKGVDLSEKLDAMAVLTSIAEKTDAKAVVANEIGTPESTISMRSTPHEPANSPRTSPSKDTPDQSDLFSINPEAVAINEPYVSLGSNVCVESLSDGGKKLSFVLVADKNDPNSGEVGIHTPLGKALLDTRIGDEVEYQAGSYIREVRVLDIR